MRQIFLNSMKKLLIDRGCNPYISDSPYGNHLSDPCCFGGYAHRYAAGAVYDLLTYGFIVSLIKFFNRQCSVDTAAKGNSYR